jgi:hypothetical protein
MSDSSKIRMGNDELILFIRKNNPGCKLHNEVLGRKIWEWIKENDNNAIQVEKDAPCLWGDNTPNTAPESLPKTATQFEFEINLLPRMYNFLKEIDNN